MNRTQGAGSGPDTPDVPRVPRQRQPGEYGPPRAPGQYEPVPETQRPHAPEPEDRPDGQRPDIPEPPATDLADGPAGSGTLLVVLCLAQFMAVLDVSVVNVALPSIGSSLRLGGDALPWVITAYTVTFGGLLVLGGRVADGLSRRRAFQAGLAVFTLASLTAGLSTDAAALLGSRVGQGVGAALLSPAALSLLTTEFTGKALGRALGVWSAIGAAGAAVGVVVGGALTSGPGWHWAFYVNVPVGAVLFAAAPAVVPSRPRTRGTRLDLLGALTGTGSVALLIHGLVRAGDQGWGSAGALAAIGAGVLLAAGFVVAERTVRDPLVPPHLFRRPPLPGAVVVMAGATAALLGTYFLASFHLQHDLGWSPLHAGLVFLPVAFATAVGAHLASRQVSRRGPRPTGLAALLAAAAGLGLMAWRGVHGGVWTTLMPGFLVAAAGIGAAFVTATTSGLSGMDEAHAGVASGLFSTGHEVGGSLGIALVSSIAATGIAAGPVPSPDGFRHAFAALAAGVAVLAFATARLLPRRVAERTGGPVPLH
ncbi:MFS transporter [Actinacidiphila acididurans]|uniref:MFS transporter n=1 Tax=Actinacidiphila acididurans TaxID=2784346 RepID=A0ABS2TXW2_9ACTN|nr:MFS transporter [Actinacidiphila acididurans]MBM9508180.1 MFS transporter [Actinacidiphila acididurans]